MKAPGGFLSRLFALPSLCLNPFDLAFVFSGGLLAFSLAGGLWAMKGDRSKSGAVAGWALDRKSVV